MGFGGISIWQLLIILAIIILIFGTRRFRNMGGDLGSAFKNFRKAVKEDQDDNDYKNKNDRIIDIEDNNRKDKS